MKIDRSASRAYYNIPTVSKIEENFGRCKNYRLCKQDQVILGNGLCVACWDKKTGV